MNESLFSSHAIDDYDCYVNLDSPDIVHFVTSDDESEFRAIRLTVLDVNGEPVHSVFNLASLNTLIDDLSAARDNISDELGDSNDSI